MTVVQTIDLIAVDPYVYSGDQKVANFSEKLATF